MSPVPGGGQPTIVSIARQAGVSIASVSRVLNGLGARRETVERVERAASDLGYVPNAVARSLKDGRTRQLTFALPDIGNPAYVAMVRAVQSVTKTAGYRLLLHSTDAAVDDELAVLRSLGDRTSDGLIICPIRITDDHIEALTCAAGPVVVMGSLPSGVPVDSVRADSVTGAALAVRHLHDTGCRRIAFINGPSDTVPGRNREEGYRAALAECGLVYDDALVAETGFGIEAGARAAAELLGRPARRRVLRQRPAGAGHGPRTARARPAHTAGRRGRGDGRQRARPLRVAPADQRRPGLGRTRAARGRTPAGTPGRHGPGPPRHHGHGPTAPGGPRIHSTADREHEVHMSAHRTSQSPNTP